MSYNPKNQELKNISRFKIEPIRGISFAGKNIFYKSIDNKIFKCDTSEFAKGRFGTQSLDWEFPYIDSCVWFMNNKGFQKINIKDPNNYELVLENKQVSHLHLDSFKHLWASTLSNGFFIRNSPYIRNFNFPNNGFSNSIYSLYKIENQLYCGNGFGDVFEFNLADLQSFVKNKIPSDYIRSFKVLKFLKYKNRIFCATEKGVYEKTSTNKFKICKAKIIGAIKNMYILDDTLYVLYNYGFSRINIKDDYSIENFEKRNRLYSFITYNKKEVFGGEDSLYYFENHKFKIYPLDKPFSDRPVDLTIKDSILIATTAENGIYFIHDTSVIKNINTSNGWSTNTCYKSVLYKNSLYTASNKGINIYNFSNDSIYHLFESDGLPSNSVFDLAIENDTIFAATESGLSIIPFSAIQRNKSFPLFVQPIIINKDTIWKIPEQIQLRTDDNFQIVVNGLSYGVKAPLKYAYRIVGIDSMFKFTQDQNISIRLTKHGNYELELYAINQEGTKSNLVILKLHIHPYFYQTWLFRILVLASFIIAIIMLYKFLLERARKKEHAKNELETKIRNLELSAWKSAINPHFLFNSLNTMQGLFRSNDFEKANNYVTEFSSMLRKTIDQSGKILIPLEEKINYLKNYLELEKIKRLGAFDFEFVIHDEHIKKYLVPSLLIQPILENSLKHGIKDKDNGFIKVTFEQINDKIRCIIEDNGNGFDPKKLHQKENSKGLKLIRTKISIVEQLIKQKIEFSYSNRVDANKNIIGTQTIYTLPFITENYET